MRTPCPRRRLTAAAAACAWTLALAASASAHAPTASFEYSPQAPAPGQPVDFHSTTTPVPEHTEPLQLDWDLDGDGEFDDARGATARAVFAQGSDVVRLRARYVASSGDHEDVAERTLTVGSPPPPPPEETPAPGANRPPVAAFDRKCTKTGGFSVCAGLFAREQKPHTIDASPSHDPDGSIARYQWDLDGNGTFEVDGGASPMLTHTFEHYKGQFDPGKRTVRLRVTDDKGASAEAALTLTLLEPACEPLVRYGRLSATGLCMKPRHVEVETRRRLPDGRTIVQTRKVVRWYSERPVTINGFTVVPAPDRSLTIELPDEPGAPAPRIASNGAAVIVPAVQGTAKLVDGAFAWRLLDGEHLSGFGLADGAELNGLRVTGLAEQPSLDADNTSSRFAMRLALPAQFGGATSDQPVVVSPGKAVASASKPLRFEVAGAAVGPIGLERLVVTFDGEDLWEIETAIRMPDPIPYRVAGDAGIRSNGDFEHAGAEVDFGTPGIGVGPVFLQRIAFRVEVKPKRSKCVPKTGIETIDVQELLKPLMGEDFRIPEGWTRYFQIDHGIPTFALCGEVGLTGGPSVLGAAAIRMDAGLGLATYDDRPTVFRAFGKLYLVELPLAKASFELHTNGYMKAHADFKFAIPDIASLEGFLSFEMLKAKFNAEAYVRACVDLVDLCAGARALVSSKGLAVCLHIDVLGGNWEPGFGYAWDDVFPTPYFTGCDVGDYREHIDSGIDDHIVAVPSSAAVPVARAAGYEQAIDLPAGLPGAVFVAEGKDAPPKITLVGPRGERLTTPDGMTAVQRKPFLLMKNLRGRTTQIAVGAPAGGRWRVIVEDGSSPVVSIRSAQGLPEPEVSARVVGHGRKRAVAYRIEPRAGQRVTLVERGASAGGIIGEAAGATGRVRFSPADGDAERRAIVAIVRQDGQVRDELTVAHYAAPGPRRPGKPHRLRVARHGTSLRVAWKPGRPAGSQEVRVRLGDGRRLFYRTHRHRLTVRHVRRGVRATVIVRGVMDTGVKGRPAVFRSRRR
jgi:hypothetical protein